jgi:predicted amidophosphoribosyltransferase
MDDDEPEGDAVQLYQLGDSDNCPVCGAMLPSFEYCPHCGQPWKWTGE